MQDTINQFLEFRKQFTASQWHEINNIIDSQYRKKSRRAATRGPRC